MELALAIAIGSVVAGVLAAVAASARLWVLAPVRAFAVVAVATAIAVHILPEAVDGGGWWVLVVAAIGLVAPIALGRATATIEVRHRRVAAELGYLAVLVHQVSDGLALGAATGGGHEGHTHWDLLIGVGAHTVPLVAMLALTFAELGGLRAAIVRSIGLLAATVVGLLFTRLDDTFLPAAEPWLNAAVSGLLLHVLVHDSDEREVPAATRPLEALGAALGATLPFVTGGHEHGAVTHALREQLSSVIVVGAPLVLVALVIAVVVAPARRALAIAAATSPRTVLALVVVAYAVTSLGSVDGLAGIGTRLGSAAARMPVAVGVGAAVVLALLALGRIARSGFMAWLGTGHDHHGHGHGGGRHDHGDHGHAH